MKSFGDIKNIRRFAVLSILKGGTTRHKLTGIFCALLLINFGFACPTNSRVNSLAVCKVTGIAKPINTTVSTPVWSVNAPTAFEVDSNGKAEPFLFSAKRTNFTVMLSTEKDCSNGITTPHKTRTPTKRASSTKSTERLLKQLTDKVITLQRDNEAKKLSENFKESFGVSDNSCMFASFLATGTKANEKDGHFYVLLTTLIQKIRLFKSHVSRYFSKAAVPVARMRGGQSFLFYNNSKFC